MIKIAALVCLYACTAQATTIIVQKTTKHIVVAADSLFTSQDLTPIRFGCKLRRANNIYFTGSERTMGAQQALRIAWESMLGSRSASQAARKFGLRSQEMADRAKFYYPREVKECLGGHICGEFLFFEVEHGVPKLTTVKMEFAGTFESFILVPHTFDCPGTCLDTEKVSFCMGVCAGITPESFKTGLPDTDTARKLVSREEQLAPQLVGGPIDVLTLDASGAHWELTQGGTCSPDEDPKPHQKPH